MADLQDLINASKREDWKFIKDNMGTHLADSTTVGWALREGLDDPDGNVRDLAASILEKTKAPLTPQTREKLLQMVKTDENPYAQFRSAFALFTHGDESESVIAKIWKAKEDKDVALDSQEYRDKLSKD